MSLIGIALVLRKGPRAAVGERSGYTAVGKVTRLRKVLKLPVTLALPKESQSTIVQISENHEEEEEEHN